MPDKNKPPKGTTIIKKGIIGQEYSTIGKKDFKKRLKKLPRKQLFNIKTSNLTAEQKQTFFKERGKKHKKSIKKPCWGCPSYSFLTIPGEIW